ncbi:uncharacterized protein LOC114525914 [Dendronephthya gigantea]|uniref:uncharacterized protein LOC114525914 n=1 Tax=Dendronephthya gigantea TaxID=151771 RepID=UPI001069B6C7|nr:uncharacterized protein LOC114525914 [Dendronephthya gigantea]
MSGLPWETEESQNYIRADYIVTDAVRKELRDFFIQKWNKRYQASLGAWDDTNVSGSQLFNLEKKRARPNKTMLQSKFQNGNTNEWDCTVLFDAILYSNSIGGSLSTKEKTEIDILRKLRNEITHNIPDKTLTNKNFQTMTTKVENALGALRLSINEVVRIKNLFASFIILPPEPAHEVVYRSDKIHEIREDIEKLRSDNDGKLTYFYISGNPGSGKSQLARQVCEDICKDVHVKDEAMFVMTLNGKDLDSLFYSYEDFCRRLNCNESALQSVSSSSKTKEEKIKDLRSQISCRINNWKKWWIIVDNVENLKFISPLLPLKGDEVWKDGQVILTTQNTNAAPQDSISTKHISLIHGMNDQECRQLLVLLSRTEANDPILDEVAEKLDRQPLAMAAAAVYMREVTNSCPDFSWRDYLRKLEKGKRGLTEHWLQEINSAAYSSTMSTAVLLAVEKCAGNNTILEHAFNLFSLISFEPLPLDLVVKYVQQQEDLEAEDIIPTFKTLLVLDRLGPKHTNVAISYSNLGDVCYDKGHLDLANDYYQRALEIELDRLGPNHTNVAMSYSNLGDVCKRKGDLDLANDYYQRALEIQLDRLGPKHTNVAISYSNLGDVCYSKGDLDIANDYYQRALEIQLDRLGPNHTNVAISYSNLGDVCKSKGDLERANDYYQCALEIDLDRLGPNHTNVAITYSKLGSVCESKGDLDLANDYYQRGLEIQLDRVAISYSNLGDVCKSKGDLERANDYYQCALEIDLDRLGPNHTNVAITYSKLGSVCESKGDLDLANDYYQRGLEIQLDRRPNHTNVAITYSNLGSV